MVPEIVTEHPVIDSIFRAHQQALGPTYPGLRNHAYRMLNYVGYLHSPEMVHDERVAVVCAFHDLVFGLSGDLDYLGPSADLAQDYLRSTGHPEWADEVRAMIENHHKVTPYRGPSAPLVEAIRKADWIDVTFGALRFGIPRPAVREITGALPLDGFYTPQPALGRVLRYAVRHPRRPLPLLRW